MKTGGFTVSLAALSVAAEAREHCLVAAAQILFLH